MCYFCHDWKIERSKARDFRQDHGGGPEEMPHRKKGTGKKFCKKNKGPHVYDAYTEWQYYGPRYRTRYACCKCGKRSMYGYQSQRLQERTYTMNGEEFTRSYWL